MTDIEFWVEIARQQANYQREVWELLCAFLAIDPDNALEDLARAADALEEMIDRVERDN